MKLSILIPMFNAKNYIGNCIDSLLNQDLSQDDYEIIIMDDGSKDNSVEIVKAYIKKHKNISLYQESNSGAFSTRNKLLKLAKGDYIYNLDADDYIVHNCLAIFLNIAESKQLDIIGFDTIETSDLDKLELTKSIDLETVEYITGKELIENYIHYRHEIWWYFIKRDFLIKHNMVFNNNEYNADVMFTLEALIKSEKVGYFPISIHRYVQTENSLMRSTNWEVVRKRIEYLQMMIGNSSQLINTLNTGSNSEVLLENMRYRRDIFTFFNIINMLRNPFSLSYVKSKITVFKSLGAYPINNFNNFKYSGIHYRILLFIINNQSFLNTLFLVKNWFTKSFK
ncbi:glycosyltransferase family 2 protein [Winogradskyella sp. PG-2]|uniref:glycosyltransferase family 2 protein n=1 Tax=Winogradskyella sp. PG-2 TaxID=754409 RepID=UPI00045877E2|nr:glycosyltransferase [Winogradskyella sp. PG-2]BAO77197.1 beta-1,3-glucosyltransferase [Winogradskyella sp. PG-2]